MFAHATHSPSHGIADSLSLFFARLGAAFAGVAEATRVYKQLSALSGSALAARGLVREDIGRMTSQAMQNGCNR